VGLGRAALELALSASASLRIRNERISPLTQPEREPALAHAKEDHSDAEHPKAHECAREHERCENVWRPPQFCGRSPQADEKGDDDQRYANGRASRTQTASVEALCSHAH
jgi:hypothetical protein